MNKRGTSENLVAAHPGNTNAVRHGVFSARSIEARASEIEDRLLGEGPCSPLLRDEVNELARLLAIREKIDRDLDERGLHARKGQPHYLLPMRLRVAKQIERSFASLKSDLERQVEANTKPAAATRRDCSRELERIALRDSRATPRDRIDALKERATMHGVPYADVEEPLAEMFERLNKALGETELA